LAALKNLAAEILAYDSPYAESHGNPRCAYAREPAKRCLPAIST
jgi:hypothetical protein